MRCHFLDSIPGGGLESLAHASAVLLDAAASTTVSELSESVSLGPKTFFRLNWKHQGAFVSPPDVVVLRKLIALGELSVFPTAGEAKSSEAALNFAAFLFKRLQLFARACSHI